MQCIHPSTHPPTIYAMSTITPPPTSSMFGPITGRPHSLRPLHLHFPYLAKSAPPFVFSPLNRLLGKHWGFSIKDQPRDCHVVHFPPNIPKMPSSSSFSCLFSKFSLLSLLAFASLSFGQPAAWPATSYSPYFQSMFSQASAPVAALPSGAGAQAPAIPVGGGGSPGGPGPGPAFSPPGKK